MNSKKLIAIEEMKSPTCHKEVQRLNGHLTALGRFLSASCEKSLPFFQVLPANKRVGYENHFPAQFQNLNSARDRP